MNDFTAQYRDLTPIQRFRALMRYVIHPGTSNLRQSVDAASGLGLEVAYSCDDKTCDLGPVFEALQTNPAYLKAGHREVLTEMMDILDQNQAAFALRSIDYFYFQSNGFPLLSLRNVTPVEIKIYSGVSNFLEVGRLRSAFLQHQISQESLDTSNAKHRKDILITLGATALSVAVLVAWVNRD